jgi:hypothetical protein
MSEKKRINAVSIGERTNAVQLIEIEKNLG